MDAGTPPPLALWAGVECTVNRIGNRWSDQLERSGHAAREEDMERLAALGVRTVRYPVLWERTVRRVNDAPDWRWSDARLERLRGLGIRPVVGLLHHGSGPPGTSLEDPAFPERFADFARAVAERYPWVEAYTPINEPLTTARFSGLYGHWYPHARHDRPFARMLVAQCRATVLAMHAIRTVNPDAFLVQTEDLGRIHAVPALAYQAAFENERRWATWDLLGGTVDRSHPLYGYLRAFGVPERVLAALRDDAVPPDIIGVNHYLTSERFLDNRLDRYPEMLHGGNGRDRYADVEAVRVPDCTRTGARALLLEAWRRYRRPVAITEAHLGCTREQQLRWLAQLWGDAGDARADGADVRAVTVWSTFGAHDWASLLTREDGHYEPGAYDVRALRPRPTALARMAHALATTGAHDHPALDTTGWWESETRFLHRVPAGVHHASHPVRRPPRPRTLLITGASGTLGRALTCGCVERGLAHVALAHDALDVCDGEAVHAALRRHRVWGVVNCAGYVRVDDAEWDAGTCDRVNRHGAATLAEVCAEAGVALVTFSSDLVFGDPGRATPYVERDTVAPLGVYGASKAAAERAVLARYPDALVVRTSAFFGPCDEANFLTQALRTIAAGETFEAADDVTVSPTYVPDLAHAVLELLVDAESGVWHLASDGAVTWAELARRGARAAGLDEELVVPCTQQSLFTALPFAAPRPPYSVLGSERGALMPSLDSAIARYAAARPWCTSISFATP